MWVQLGASLVPSVVRLSSRPDLQLVFSAGSLGPFIFGAPFFCSAKATYEECCELVIRGSFVDYIPVFLVCLAFKYYLFVSGILRRMDKEYALVCYVFGSMCRSSHVQFGLVLLFLTCVG